MPTALSSPVSTNQLPRPLAGRNALVTGGSRGIGFAICQALAKAGANLAVSSRQGLLSPVIQAVEAENVSCFAGICDVTDEYSVASYIENAQEQLGPIDILVNNAGIYRVQAVCNHDLSTWQEVIDTNLSGALRLSRQLIQGMTTQNWGRVINIASISAIKGEVNGSAYSASKFGMIGLTQSLALEVAKFGVTVNAVCPGWVLTDMSRNQLTDETWCEDTGIATSESIDIARLSVPQMRFIEAEEVASLVTYLCSQDARGITGQAINVCGGLSLT